MTRDELAFILDIPNWQIDDYIWDAESHKILDAINHRQCMYCEKTVEYSSGVFVCHECASCDEESGLLKALKEAVSILHNIGFEGDISHITKLIKKS